jgi:hypothetical protein
MLKRTPIAEVALDEYDVLPLGTKGEIAAFVAAWIESGDEVSDMIHDVTPAQVSAFRKALADLNVADSVTIQTLSTVTGSKTHTINRKKKDGTPLSYDVTRQTRERNGIFLQLNA